MQIKPKKISKISKENLVQIRRTRIEDGLKIFPLLNPTFEFNKGNFQLPILSTCSDYFKDFTYTSKPTNRKIFSPSPEFL